ncbi:MAG TPA: sialidase family protein [Blastocatellia bacterium]|nr:sialidase family protein [Blastocatellia bacterium]
MNKRISFVVLLLFIFALVAVAPTPLSRRAEAQSGVAFGATRFPAIDVDKGDNLYLMMSVATAPASEHRPHSQIFFTQSRDGGATWDNVPLTRNLSKSPGEAFGPSLAVTKQGTTRVYVTYHDDSTGVTQAYLIRSKKRAKFRKPQNITPHDGGAFAPRVALDSAETVHVVWGDTKNGSRIAFVRSTDLGETFSEPLFISGSSTAAFDPEIAVDSTDTINVVWQDGAVGANGSIMFSRSTDGGQTFSAPLRVSTDDGRATEAHIAADSANHLHVVWVQETGTTTQGFYSRSTDGGQTFSEPVNVSNFPGGDIHKIVITTFEDKTIYIAFQNGDLFGENSGPNRQVFLVKSDDAGLTFFDPVQVSNADNNKGRAHSPAIVVDSRGVLHIVWIDASLLPGDEGLLFYSNSTNGRRFSKQQLILAIVQV